MSERQETIDDIIAEKRRRADEIERDCAEKMKRGEMVSDCYARELVADIRREADRLEAAHRRERGNSAALREACAEAAESAAEIMERVRHKDRLAFNTANYIAGVARTALAAPPRNCDRFGGDIDKLREACARERGLNPEEDFPDVFPDWLLALAQEGGAK